MTDKTEERAQAAFRVAQARWRDALNAHRLAPPDAGFRARLAELSVAAHAESEACRDAEAAGFEWPPHRASSSEPPYSDGEDVAPGGCTAQVSRSGIETTPQLLRTPPSRALSELVWRLT